MIAAGDGNLGGLYVLILVGLYWLPAVLAFARKHHQRGAILVINLFLGWTVIGWIVALAMASGHVKHERPRQLES